MGHPSQSHKRQQPQKLTRERVRVVRKVQAKNEQEQRSAKIGQRSTLIESKVKKVPREEDRNLPSDSDSSTIHTRHDSSQDIHKALYTVDTSYRTLLQSLTDNSQRDVPIQKKRRMVPPRESPPPITDIDVAQEPNETAEIEYEGTDGSEVDNTEDDLDPFHEHFDYIQDKRLNQLIQAATDNKWLVEKSSVGSSWLSGLKIPDCPSQRESRKPSLYSKYSELPLKQKLKNAPNKFALSFDPLLAHLASHIFSYQDLLFSDRKVEDADQLRDLTALHVVNHVFKTRDKVLRNNVRVLKENNSDGSAFQDQGFTRPKVLILLPTRQSCLRWAEAITSKCRLEQQENKKRFLESYGQEVEQFPEGKPADFQDLFGGNDDDSFRLGMKLTRKTVKYFAQFYSSDIILASPLGLRMALKSNKTNKEDYDFLSSIEISIIDQADALSMQNWDHVDFIFNKINLQPKEAHGCDFSRVRNSYLDGHAKYLRQTILLSTFNFPSLNKIFLSQLCNVAGKARVSCVYGGAIFDLRLLFRQIFSRYDTLSPLLDPEDRFNYFIAAVLPSLTKYSGQSMEIQQGILIFLPLYADFVRLRNQLASSPATQHISFGSISEYTPTQDASRALSHFYTGRHSLLLYSERAHHFRRYRIKGVKQIVMYGLPENPIFYKELAAYLSSSISEGKIEAHRTSIRALFSKFDLLKIERIVGTLRYQSLLRDQGDTFEFL
ncbi:MAG: hypothetical protein Q9167_007147 [Letrouitia subvulpina]